MKRNFLKLSVLTALAAGMACAQTTTPAAPQTNTTPAPRHRAAMRQRMMQALNLTDDQKQQAKAIFQSARQSTQPLRQQLMQNRQAMAAAVKANDTAQIQQLATQQGNLMGQLVAARTEAMAQFYATLTPDQRAKADQIQQRRQQHMAQRKNG